MFSLQGEMQRGLLCPLFATLCRLLEDQSLIKLVAVRKWPLRCPAPANRCLACRHAEARFSICKRISRKFLRCYQLTQPIGRPSPDCANRRRPTADVTAVSDPTASSVLYFKASTGLQRACPPNKRQIMLPKLRPSSIIATSAFIATGYTAYRYTASHNTGGQPAQQSGK